MKTLKRCVAGLLVFTVTGFCYPQLAFCEGATLSAKANAKAITQHEPRIKSEPERDIALESGKKKPAKWLLYGLGAALVVGLALGAGGGSSSGDSAPPNDNTPAGDGSGTVTVGW